LDFLQNILTQTLDFFFSLIPNYGVAIILLTLVLKAILYWPQQQSLMSSRKMQSMTPEMQEIQKRFKGDPDQLNKAMSQLYKKYGINPVGCFTSSCLLQIPQLLIMWALWFALQAFFLAAVQVPMSTPFLGSLTPTAVTPTIPADLFHTYTTTMLNGSQFALVARAATPGAMFLGFNLAYTPTGAPHWIYYLWPALTAATMFLQSKTMGQSQTQQGGAAFINILFPLLIGWISISIPVAVCLYWVVFSLLQVAQQLFVFKGIPKPPAAAQTVQVIPTPPQALPGPGKKKAKGK
jgi:YidC/Oxa1 family membrane protein insertase